MSKLRVFGVPAGVAVMAVIVLQLVGVWSCSEDRSDGLVDMSALAVKRELGAAYFEEGRFELANSVLTWVSEQVGASAQDLVNVVCVEMASTRPVVARCVELLDRAEALDPELAAVPYCRGILAKRNVEFEAARDHFQRALERAPEDLPTRAHLAEVLCALDQTKAGIEHFERILESGVEFGGGYYALATYRLGTELIRSRDPEKVARGLELRGETERLRAAGIKSPGDGPLAMGNLAAVVLPRLEGSVGAAPHSTSVTVERVEEGLAASVGEVRCVRAVDMNGDHRIDLVVAGAGGVVMLVEQDGQRVELPVHGGDWRDLEVAVLHNVGRNHRGATPPEDGRCSVLLMGEQGMRFLFPGPDGELMEGSLPASTPVTDAAFVDFDHEGDLDLLLAGPEGLMLWRNNGVPAPDAENSPRPPQWTDVTAAASMPTGSFTWVDFEDFDADQDVDFIAGGQGVATVILSSLRGGRFEVLPPGRTGLGADLPTPPVLVDLNHDGFADVAGGATSPAVFLNRGDGTFASPDGVEGVTWTGAITCADLNLDGEVDLLESTAGSLSFRAGSVLADARSVSTSLEVPWSLPQAPITLDLDGDGDEDLLGCTGTGIDVYRNGAGTDLGRLRLTLRGVEDNRPAVAAIVEVRHGPLYQRRMYRGGPLVVGLGPLTTAMAARPMGTLKDQSDEIPTKEKGPKRDVSVARGGPEVVKVRWQNGVVQYDLHLRPKSARHMNQKEGDPGSCPFLYTFNGEEYEFITDVLGTTPLGLPMAEGQYVPPDHDELVRIEGRQLAPKDGEYVMSITEELREVTYLDRAQLWVVDHPADVEVHPEERFTFPPFPPLKVHTVRGALPVMKATDQDGRDWTEVLQTVDDVHAIPFDRRPSQFRGLATPHHLDLTLPPEVAGANKVRLLMTGWFQWTDASVNIATDQHPTFEFVPPLLMVPDESGEFVPTGPPVGFPAGKTKTMVLDVSDILNREDTRLRVHSTLCLYWDAIRVAVDDDDAPIQVTRLEPTRADLAYRGFSRPILTGREDLPERFEYHELRPAPWNQHQGMMTAYGDVLPLLGKIDDRFAIFSAGDFIDLRFDAGQAPVLSGGQARTFLLYLDGWAKDADPNTTFPGTVEPLPFHGMSGYPYGADEAYPDDVEHREYRARWNTRPGRLLEWDLTEPGS